MILSGENVSNSSFERLKCRRNRKLWLLGDILGDLWDDDDDDDYDDDLL